MALASVKRKCVLHLYFYCSCQIYTKQYEYANLTFLCKHHQIPLLKQQLPHAQHLHMYVKYFSGYLYIHVQTYLIFTWILR